MTNLAYSWARTDICGTESSCWNGPCEQARDCFEAFVEQMLYARQHMKLSISGLVRNAQVILQQCGVLTELHRQDHVAVRAQLFSLEKVKIKQP